MEKNDNNINVSMWYHNLPPPPPYPSSPSLMTVHWIPLPPILTRTPTKGLHWSSKISTILKLTGLSSSIEFGRLFGVALRGMGVLPVSWLENI